MFEILSAIVVALVLTASRSEHSVCRALISASLVSLRAFASCDFFLKLSIVFVNFSIIEFTSPSRSAAFTFFTTGTTSF